MTARRPTPHCGSKPISTGPLEKGSASGIMRSFSLPLTINSLHIMDASSDVNMVEDAYVANTVKDEVDTLGAVDRGSGSGIVSFESGGPTVAFEVRE